MGNCSSAEGRLEGGGFESTGTQDQVANTLRPRETSADISSNDFCAQVLRRVKYIHNYIHYN